LTPEEEASQDEAEQRRGLQTRLELMACRALLAQVELQIQREGWQARCGLNFEAGTFELRAKKGPEQIGIDSDNITDLATIAAYFFPELRWLLLSPAAVEFQPDGPHAADPSQQ